MIVAGLEVSFLKSSFYLFGANESSKTAFEEMFLLGCGLRITSTRN
jgi:hypothetical protein